MVFIQRKFKYKYSEKIIFRMLYIEIFQKLYLKLVTWSKNWPTAFTSLPNVPIPVLIADLIELRIIILATSFTSYIIA
ncbi:hypothetical protein FC27_GL002166 [Companilactobacillus versmoldensis DSM 14857 = KCTC 3814]|uniref:Uncharacterized protein n=1 Tax=Companilactobacillus versmoldensis DSM 14857 = KCTC 3814 TaxID=1423815 RepID=A0A0R1SD05_9LACO|nr:hypothetical protein FC27_GL002166 [Companilactobacillus versmoldensis DSM 14857 = KCTC 3814]